MDQQVQQLPPIRPAEDLRLPAFGWLNLMTAIYVAEIAFLAVVVAVILTRAAPAPSGPLIIGLSMALTGGMIACGLVRMKSRTDYNTLVSEYAEAEFQLKRGEALAARIKSFEHKIKRQRGDAGTE